MLFLQTKFVKGKKVLYKNYFVIFTNFFLNNHLWIVLFKKIAYKIVCKIFFSVCKKTTNELTKLSRQLFLIIKDKKSFLRFFNFLGLK